MELDIFKNKQPVSYPKSTQDALNFLNEQIQAINIQDENDRDFPDASNISSFVKNAYEPFFEDMYKLAKSQASQSAGHDTQRGQGLKQDVIYRLPGFQDCLKSILNCYIKGHYYRARMDHGLKRARERLGFFKVDNPGEINELLRKKRKEKQKLTAEITHLKNARPIIEKIEKNAAALEKELYDALGRDEGAVAYRSVTSKARSGNFDDALKAAKALANKKGKGIIGFKSGKMTEIAKKAEKLVAYYQDNSQWLFSSDKRLYLRLSEIDYKLKQAYDEWERVEVYLHKYYFAFLEAEMRDLNKTRKKLERIGDPEKLLNWHQTLIEDIAENISDSDRAYNFENKHLIAIKQMISEQSDEIQRLDRSLDGLMQEFDEVLEETKAYGSGASE